MNPKTFKMTHYRRFWLAIAITGTLIGIVVLHRPILVSFGRWLDVGERPRAADFVMVLPGGPERRPFVAIAMIHSGLVKGILTAQTVTDSAVDEGLTPPGDVVIKRIFRIYGINDDQIQVLPGHSDSTWTDAVALSSFLRKHPQATVAIVTDDFHTRRSRWVFRKVLGTDSQRVYFVSAPPDSAAPDNWWMSEEGLLTYVGEYCKLTAYVATDLDFILLAIAITICSALVIVMRNRLIKSRRVE